MSEATEKLEVGRTFSEGPPPLFINGQPQHSALKFGLSYRPDGPIELTVTGKTPEFDYESATIRRDELSITLRVGCDVRAGKFKVSSYDIDDAGFRAVLTGELGDRL